MIWLFDSTLPLFHFNKGRDWQCQPKGQVYRDALPLPAVGVNIRITKHKKAPSLLDFQLFMTLLSGTFCFRAYYFCLWQNLPKDNATNLSILEVVQLSWEKRAFFLLNSWFFFYFFLFYNCQKKIFWFPTFKTMHICIWKFMNPTIGMSYLAYVWVVINSSCTWARKKKRNILQAWTQDNPTLNIRYSIVSTARIHPRWFISDSLVGNGKIRINLGQNFPNKKNEVMRIFPFWNLFLTASIDSGCYAIPSKVHSCYLLVA